MICKYPCKILSTTCVEVTDVHSTEVNSAIDKLMNEYKKEKRQGLAANQVGLKLRVAVVRLSKKSEPIIVINPEVTKAILFKHSLEHCESSSGWFIVSRPLLARISYLTIDGDKVNKWFFYKKARVLCHEIDHLNGKCLPDVGRISMFSDYYDKKVGYK